jgi:hypothetical protein
MDKRLEIIEENNSKKNKRLLNTAPVVISLIVYPVMLIMPLMIN